MWPFRRSPVVTLDELAYARWLRAQRPELRWFLALGEEEQEALAVIGEGYVSDLAVAIAYAIKDPQVAELGARMAAGDETAEMSLLDKIAKQSAPRARESMGGISERRQAAHASQQILKNRGRSFLGRSPDPVAT